MADDRNVKSKHNGLYSQHVFTAFTAEEKDIFDLTYTLTPAVL